MRVHRSQIKLVIFLAIAVASSRPVSDHVPTQNATYSNNSNSTDSNGNWSKIPNAIAMGISVVGILANISLLFVIYVDPLQKLRKFNWLTISNLAVADLLASASGVGLCADTNVPRIPKFILNATLYTGYSSSFFLLLLFATERYIAIKYPLHTRRILTWRRTVFCRLVCWALAAVIGTAVYICIYFSNEVSVNIYIGVFVILELTAVFMVVFKVLILCHIRKYSRRGAFLTNDGDQVGKQRKEITVTLVILIVVLLITAFPYFFAKQLEFISRLKPDRGRTSQLAYFPYYYYPIASLNFVVNPFVYAWRLKNYRNSFLALFQRKMARQNSRTPSLQTTNVEMAAKRTSC